MILNISTTDWIAMSLGILSVLLGFLSVCLTIWLANIKNKSQYILLKNKIRFLYDLVVILKSYENSNLKDKFKKTIDIERFKATLNNIPFDDNVFVQIELKRKIKEKFDLYIETCSEISNLIKDLRGTYNGNLIFPNNTSYELREVIKSLKKNLIDFNAFLNKNNILGFDLFYRTNSHPYFCFQRNVLKIINGLKFVEKSKFHIKIDKKEVKLKNAIIKLENANRWIPFRKCLLKKMEKKKNKLAKHKQENIWTNY